MKKFLIILLSIGFIESNSFSIYGMEALSPSQKSESIEKQEQGENSKCDKESMPIAYNHLTVQQQLKIWDKVYVKGLKWNAEHFEGVIEPIKMAFARVYYHLNTLKGYPYKEEAESVLRDFFAQVCDLNTNKRISGESIYNIYDKLSDYLDQMNGNKRLESNRNIDIKGGLDEVFPVIILSNPDYINSQTTIGEVTMVNQLMHENGVRFIMQLEPNYQAILNHTTIPTLRDKNP